MSGMNVVQFVKQSQVQSLCRAFIRAHRYEDWDAMRATLQLNERWGILVDWHEFAGALDYLYCIKEAIIVRPGGNPVYRMKDIVGFYKKGPLFTILEGGIYSASSDDPIVALLMYLYVAGSDGQDTVLDTLEMLLDSTQFEIQIGETVYELNERTRELYRLSKEEYDRESN